MMARATSEGSVFMRRMPANFRPNKRGQQPLKNSWSRIVPFSEFRGQELVSRHEYCHGLEAERFSVCIHKQGQDAWRRIRGRDDARERHVELCNTRQESRS